MLSILRYFPFYVVTSLTWIYGECFQRTCLHCQSMTDHGLRMKTRSLKAFPIYSSKWCIVLQTDSYKLQNITATNFLKVTYRHKCYVYSWYESHIAAWKQAGSLHSSDVYRHESGKCPTLPFFLSFLSFHLSSTFKYQVSCTNGKISVRIIYFYYLFFHCRPI